MLKHKNIKKYNKKKMEGEQTERRPRLSARGKGR